MSGTTREACTPREGFRDVSGTHASRALHGAGGTHAPRAVHGASGTHAPPRALQGAGAHVDGTHVMQYDSSHERKLKTPADF